MNLLLQNRHWNPDFRYGFEKKRNQYHILLKYLKDKQIIALTGLRRVGKTTLLKQLIDFLAAEKVDSRKILFFSFDENGSSLDELLKKYSSESGVDIAKDKVYLFLDEIQKLQDWQEKIKIYYDSYPNIKFFVSGSQSLFVKKKSRESLAGRIFIIEIPLLSFKEYLLFSDKENILENPIMFKEDIKKEILAYLRRGYIEMIGADDEKIKFFLESLINKIVYEDIPLIFPVESPEKLKSLLQSIYSNPGAIMRYESIAGDLGISSKTAEKYSTYLIEANLAKKVYNYSRNFLTSEKKLKRLYTTASCLCFLNDNYDITRVAENQIANEFSFFWRDSFGHEVDFIKKEGDAIIPIEVKYSNNFKKEWIKPMIIFMEKNNAKEGIIITEDYEETINVGDKKISLIPFWKRAILSE